MNAVGTRNESNRHDWIRQQLREIPAGSRLLDAGAGEQQYRPDCRHLTYVAQDFGQYDGGGDGSGLHCGQWNYGDLDIVGDITSISEPDGSFDAILCAEVIEHVPRPLAALKELSRLLRIDGRLILTAPFLSLTHFAPYHFATGFNRYFYETHLPALGLRVDDISTNGNYFELVAQELRRLPHVAERYVDGSLRIHERLLLKPLLAALSRFSQKDQGSDELGCFGLHVLATRVPLPDHTGTSEKRET